MDKWSKSGIYKSLINSILNEFMELKDRNLENIPFADAYAS